MSNDAIYLRVDGYTYIRVDPASRAREILSLELAIRLAEEKVSELRSVWATLQLASEHQANALEEDIHDIELAIDDLGVHLDHLRNA